MRAIASDFFANSPFMAGPQIAMVIFLAVFLVVLVRVLRTRAAHWEGAARLPLEDLPLDDGGQSAARESSVGLGVEEAGNE